MTSTSEKGDEFDGFFEVLYRKDALLLLKKHRKKMAKKTENGVYYEFKDNPSYLIRHSGEFYKIKNENSLTAVFPESKDIVRAYTTSHKELKEQNYDQYIIGLIKSMEN